MDRRSCAAALGWATTRIQRPHCRPIRTAPRASCKPTREALTALDPSRKNGHRAGLVVLVTGLGKTWLAAFDTMRLKVTRCARRPIEFFLWHIGTKFLPKRWPPSARFAQARSRATKLCGRRNTWAEHCGDDGVDSTAQAGWRQRCIP